MSIDLRHFTTHDAGTIRTMLLDVHDDCYADQQLEPFHERERFGWFVDNWSAHPDFACVVAYDGGEPVGFAYGAPAAEGQEWWRKSLDPAPDHSQTFALSELMVRPRWRKTGASELLHTELVEQRPEAMAVLLVDSTHPKVQRLYESWHYKKVGEHQPFPDSPTYAVMLRDLHTPVTS
ncbi:hypothetical protein GCM10009864_65570 [Streptomyces lunalinharesii]|uniref:N-acetyltransferase domain-containing protein n=1 Tax=Streptomyces lunalinharesii TaxID=333384 RepID=A0ABN3SRF7_9ACTN